MPFMYSLTNGPSSQANDEFVECALYVRGMEMKARIFKARSDANLTQEQLAAATDPFGLTEWGLHLSTPVVCRYRILMRRGRHR